jgi:hypothetical protein
MASAVLEMITCRQPAKKTRQREPRRLAVKEEYRRGFLAADAFFLEVLQRAGMERNR